MDGHEGGAPGKAFGMRQREAGAHERRRLQAALKRRLDAKIADHRKQAARCRLRGDARAAAEEEAAALRLERLALPARPILLRPRKPA